MGLGLLLWGMISLATGWVTSNFGLFGLNKRESNVPLLNYIGFGLTLVSAIAFAFVKSEVAVIKKKDENVNLLSPPMEKMDEEEGFFEKMSDTTKRIIGISLSIFAGLCYGSNFNPPQYLMDHNLGPTDGLDYVFSHFTGIFLTSTFFLITYSLVKQNNPEVYPNIIVPGFISGILWALGQICFFGANSNLPFVVTFPIIGSGPGIVGSLWGIIVFKEIKGKRNILFFLLAAFLAAVGITFIVLSTIIPKNTNNSTKLEEGFVFNS